MSDRILPSGDVVTAFVYRCGKSRAECSCGWDGRFRLLRAAAKIDAIEHAYRRGCQVDLPLVCRAAVPTKSLFERLTPPVVIAAMPLLLIPAALFAGVGNAHALAVRPMVNVVVVWTGSPDCVKAWLPAGNDTTRVDLCSADKAWIGSWPLPSTPGFIGVDPEMSGADTMSCSVSTLYGPLLTDFGVRGDGNEVTCLSRWSVY